MADGRVDSATAYALYITGVRRTPEVIKIYLAKGLILVVILLAPLSSRAAVSYNLTIIIDFPYFPLSLIFSL